MHNRAEEKLSILENLSEGLKLIVLGLFFVGVCIVLTALECNHGACHMPDTWNDAFASFGR